MLKILSSNCLPSMLYVIYSSSEVRICGISPLWHPTQTVALEGMHVIKLDEQNNLLYHWTAQIIQQQWLIKRHMLPCYSASLQNLWRARVERINWNSQVINEICVTELSDKIRSQSCLTCGPLQPCRTLIKFWRSVQIKHPTQTDEELGSNFMQCPKNREGINLKSRKPHVKE